MRKVFQAWLQDTRDELQKQINGFNRHFDSTVNKSCLNSLKNFDIVSLPTTPPNHNHSNSYPDSVSSSPRLKIKRQSKLDSSTIVDNIDPSGLAQQQQKTEPDSEIVPNIQQCSETMTGTTTFRLEDTLNLQSYTYDSEYELTMSSDGKSELQPSLTLDLNNTTTYSDFPDFSVSGSANNKFIGQKPPSWTDHWKRRYQQSQETAKFRRLSLTADEFKPDACSTARSNFNLKEYYQMWNSNVSVSTVFTAEFKQKRLFLFTLPSLELSYRSELFGNRAKGPNLSLENLDLLCGCR